MDYHIRNRIERKREPEDKKTFRKLERPDARVSGALGQLSPARGASEGGERQGMEKGRGEYGSLCTLWHQR